MRAIRIFAAMALCVGLGACGDGIEEQALLGAGTGLLGSLVVDGNPVLGAAAGAAVNIGYCQQFPGRCN